MTMTTPAPGAPEDYDTRITRLGDEAIRIVDAADAEHRGFSPDEQARVTSIFNEAKTLRAAREKALGRLVLRDQIGGLGGHARAKLTPRGQAALSHPWSKAIVESYGGHLGSKQMIPPSGGVSVPSVLRPDVFAEGKTGAPIASLCSQTPIESGSFSYWRQGPRDSSAGTVPPGVQKPVTNLALTRVTDSARTIAHVARAFRQDLADSPSLAEFITSELLWGVAQELDRQIIAGDGVVNATSDNLLGILNTPGTLVQPFVTSIVTTSRKAVTQLQEKGYEPSAWAISPVDAEALDLLADTTERPLGDGPFSSGPDTLWGLPRVTSVAVPDGTAILGDWDVAILAVREEARVEWRDAGPDFERNTVAFRGEERAGFALARPEAFIEVAMTSGGA